MDTALIISNWVGVYVKKIDPLSPYLFILVLELLAAVLKNNKYITGVQIENSKFVLTNIDGSNVNLTPKGIMLGNAMFESNLPVPNCMLIFKNYLYICKLKDMLPNLNAGLQYLNSEIKMEKYSATVAILERI